VLILGGAGMLGHQIYLKLSESFEVACTLRKPASHYARFNIFNKPNVYDNVNALDFAALTKTLEHFKPNFIVNCIGLTLRKPELGDIEKCYQVNAMLPHRLAKWATQNDARVIHFSTDCVFDGKKGNYTEEDIPTANDVYGQSKFLGEISYLNSLTMRLSIVGRELEGKSELVEWFLSQRGRSAKGYGKAMYTGLTTNAVAAEVQRVIGTMPKLSGVYHVASETISKYELLSLLNEIYNLGIDLKKDNDYVSDKSLNCSTYMSLTGFKKPAWREMLTEMKNSERLKYD
jgi:dTDP-4-dehydrorhamnose reductase